MDELRRPSFKNLDELEAAAASIAEHFRTIEQSKKNILPRKRKLGKSGGGKFVSPLKKAASYLRSPLAPAQPNGALQKDAGGSSGTAEPSALWPWCRPMSVSASAKFDDASNSAAVNANAASTSTNDATTLPFASANADATTPTATSVTVDAQLAAAGESPVAPADLAAATACGCDEPLRCTALRVALHHYHVRAQRLALEQKLRVSDSSPSAGNDDGRLVELTLKWRAATIDVLFDMIKLAREQNPSTTMYEFMCSVNADPSLIGFNIDEDDFISSDDFLDSQQWASHDAGKEK